MSTLRTVSYQIPGFTVFEYRLEVPLDRYGIIEKFLVTRSDRKAAKDLPTTIDLFAREYVAKGREKAPRLIYFQGGPGFPGPRPTTISGWIGEAAKTHRILLIDERGTGNSAAIDVPSVAALGSPAVQAGYLACFRADSMIDDAEALRKELQGAEPWLAFGQSFGGFCVTTYLSRAPEGLSAATITAGLPSLDRHCDSVYRLTWAKTAARNREYFERYPEDEERLWDITCHLAGTPEYLPRGERLTPARFRMLGIDLGRSTGFESLHLLIDGPFTTVAGEKRLSQRFLTAVDAALSYAGHPVYGLLHESIYAQKTSGATDWSAHRVRQEFKEFRLADLAEGAKGERALADKHSFRFSGEHVFPWQMREDPALAPCAEAADLIAQFDAFPLLHHPEVVARNTVPAAAWIYVDDMFVPYEISMETAARIHGLKPIITNDYHHNGLGVDGPKLIHRLLTEVDAI